MPKFTSPTRKAQSKIKYLIYNIKKLGHISKKQIWSSMQPIQRAKAKKSVLRMYKMCIGSACMKNM